MAWNQMVKQTVMMIPSTALMSALEELAVRPLRWSGYWLGGTIVSEDGSNICWHGGVVPMILQNIAGNLMNI